MELELNEDTFDEHQAILIGEIIEKIKSNLEEAGLEGENLKKITGNIAFSIATTLDNSSTTEFEGTIVKPYVTFLSSENNIMHCGDFSYMHEYVFGILDEVFGN